MHSSFPDIAEAAAAVVAIGGAAFATYRGYIKWYNHNLGSRRDLAKRLNELAAGITTQWVEDRFGTPAFIKTFHRTAAGRVGARIPEGQDLKLRELIYREKHAWLQVLIDNNGAVVRFSITVTDPKFRFHIRDLTFGHMAIKLGRSRFSDLQTWASPEGRNLRIGAHNYEYAESYWFGNPGNYQHYIISHNEIGTGTFSFSALPHAPNFYQDGNLRIGDPADTHPPKADMPKFDTDATYAQQFRRETTINTLTILGPQAHSSDVAEPPGAKLESSARSPSE
jgi:hypothetical protein